MARKEEKKDEGYIQKSEKKSKKKIETEKEKHMSE